MGTNSKVTGLTQMKMDQVWEIGLEDSTIVAYHIWCTTTGVISAWDWEMVGSTNTFKEDIALYDPSEVVSHLIRRHSTDTYRPSARRIS